MSIHKLTPGSGYDYLTRQIAAQDATEKGDTGLASDYALKGETFGCPVGSGMTPSRRPPNRAVEGRRP